MTGSAAPFIAWRAATVRRGAVDLVEVLGVVDPAKRSFGVRRVPVGHRDPLARLAVAVLTRPLRADVH
jgi:hypothetical protein